jgi:hypothetical protein
MRVVYRVTQFLHALAATPHQEEKAHARASLPTSLRPLFDRLSPPDLSHSLRVWRTLQGSGENDAELLAAALLHDVGKACHPLRLWERVLVVLGTNLFPRALQCLGSGQPRGWRRAFVVARQHPQWGAELVHSAGGSERLAALIRHHQDEPGESQDRTLDRPLQSLQAADAEN